MADAPLPTTAGRPAGSRPGLALAASIDVAALVLAGLLAFALRDQVPAEAILLAAGLFVGVRATLERRRLARAETEALATLEIIRRDPLTGLLNRSAFLEALDERIARDRENVAILFFDLDRFKQVNDTFGHRIGDLLLVEIARIVRTIVPGGCDVARLSGDEFAIAMPVDGASTPVEIGLSIIDRLADTIDLDGTMVYVGASVGIAYANPGIDSAMLVSHADLAMYQSKSSQTNRLRVFDDELARQQRSDAAIRLEIGKPSWFDELTMLYQPILDVRQGEVRLYESLLRWNSPTIGQVAPDVLIPIAEDSGRINEVTDWTIRTALASLPHLGGSAVAVNVSPVTFRNPEFVHRLFDRLVEYRVQPGQLTIELTEGVLIENIERSRESINRLRDVGIRVVLDDFGTGFSSLSYLQYFALDGLKLDKSFLREIGGKSQATKIIRTMVEFGHSLEMDVFVEGVENDWQLRLLQMIGCDWAQGFKIGSPKSIADIVGKAAAPTSEEELRRALRA